MKVRTRVLGELCEPLREGWSMSETEMSKPPRLVSPSKKLGPARKEYLRVPFMEFVLMRSWAFSGGITVPVEGN